jgi:hypothetical protein
MCKELGLDFHRARQLFFQQLCDMLVILLARSLQQGVVRGILDQRMLEYVARAAASATLIEQLVLDELTETILQKGLFVGCE